VYLVGDPSSTWVPELTDEPGVQGSGCSPGSDELPSGIWFGYLVTKGTHSVTFDLACLLGPPASLPYLTQDDLDADVDWYVRNDNPKLREVPVADGAVVYQLDGNADFYLTVAFADWPLPGHTYSSVGTCPGAGCPVWLYVNGGVVTEIMERYFP